MVTVQIFHVEIGILIPKRLIPAATAFLFHPSKPLGVITILLVFTPHERLVGVGI